MYNTGYFESDIGPVYGVPEFMGSDPPPYEILKKRTLPKLRSFFYGAYCEKTLLYFILNPIIATS